MLAMTLRTSVALGSALLTLWAAGAQAQTSCEYPRMLIVLDKSSSMLGSIPGATTKWAAASDAVTTTVTTHGGGIHFGLMVFPDPNQCSPGGVKVDVGPNTASSMSSYLATPPPSGGNYTPMSQSLDAAGEYGPLLQGPQRNFVLLITDGWQWCDPYDPITNKWPVDAVRRLRAKNIKTYVVGFGSGVDVQTLNQMAFEGGTAPAGCNQNGTDPAAADRCYFQASSRADLDAALAQIARVTAAESCDGQDNDCDGYTDNATPGDPAPMSRACSSVCGGGVSTCVGGAWTACNAPQPTTESCDGQDNDCDGFTDNAMPGNPAPLTRACSNACGTGTERCEGGRWVGCDAPLPSTETCDGRDNDCDGYADNAVPGNPALLTRPCSTACGSGLETCRAGQWTDCTAPAPQAEVCGDGIDNNCNGVVDEGCECQRGETRACGSSVGQCQPGTQQCTTDGHWGDCQMGQAPVQEICNGLDDDCNGTIDNGATCEGDAICACGGCANPCRSGECPRGSTCTGGYCVFDRCPAGMHCEGTTCVAGDPPAQPADGGVDGGVPDGGAPAQNPDPGAPVSGCGCHAGNDVSGLGALLPLLVAFGLLLLRRRRRRA